MKVLILATVSLTILQLAAGKHRNCHDVDLIDEAEVECNSTEYETYVECIRKLRVKRSAACEDNNSCGSGNCEGSSNDTCNSCDCDSCSYSSCQGSCDNCCNSCCDNFVPCRTNHCCHKTCHAECKSSSCRSTCRKACYETVNRETEKETIIEKIFETGSGGSVNSTSINNNVQNITTVINLKNVINNTNIVDVPINLNYTNQNNISLTEENDDVHIESKQSQNLTDSNCCIVIGPKQCTSTDKYPFVKCFHTRSRQCGPYCAASIVHQEEREVCLQSVTGETTNCKNQVLYIPQPQPKCTYQANWPYVTCGIQNDKQVSCEGCYKHYVQSDSKEYQTCPAQCYDDGFGAGSYYRQGPFYQPSYAHAPPCYYIPGGCGGFGGYGAYNGYGGYGGYANGYGYGTPQGMQPPLGIPMSPYGPPMGGSPYGFPPPFMFPNWIPENNTEIIDNDKQNSTSLFNPVINLMPVPYPYYPNYGEPPPRDVEIEVAVEPNQPSAQLRTSATTKEEAEVRSV